MNRRVRKSVVAALFALILVVQAPVASAAAMQRDRDLEPSFIQRIVKNIKKVLKPLAPATSEDDSFEPKPPRP